MARPPKEIDKRQFENLCGIQATETEICDWFGVTEKTLNNWCRRVYGDNFSHIFQQKRSTGKISLRRYQFQQAEKSATMAIWLGKQYLGQRETIEAVAVSGESVIEKIAKQLYEDSKSGKTDNE